MERYTCQITCKLHDASYLPLLFQREGKELCLKLSDRDETDPGQVRRIVIKIVMGVEEEESNRAMDEMDRKRRPGRLEQKGKKQDQQ